MKMGAEQHLKLVADVTLLARGHVLLVRYGDTSKYDGERGWFLPDDLVAYLEHPDDAATRIVREQTGLPVPEARLDHIESFDGGTWHLVFHYRATLDQPSPVAPSGNVAEAGWFRLDRMPDRSEIAHHGWALDIVQKTAR